MSCVAAHRKSLLEQFPKSFALEIGCFKVLKKELKPCFLIIVGHQK
ncbi:hypothetical protein HMPREF0645_0721 [Hallella bergensis DSM 17361]|uniref:Uncharacterized protein n=1 Tax=Hallella bergensis DSM 17361 TaxID=585502 RepID=D1PUT6_9BACT|nr:hypothetical protein HMPREF0645_0721 [Hallella bergensis DSM 17361]